MYYKTRSRISPTDYRFVVETLARSEQEQQIMNNVIDDPEIFSMLLRKEELFRSIMKEPSCALSISSSLFFYSLIYQALNFKHIADDDMTDYISGICVEFTSNELLWKFSTDASERMVYFVDLERVLSDFNEVHQYYMHQYIGNAALFLTGFFPDVIYRREQLKGAPSLEYYELMGYTHYEAAANASLRFESDATPVLFKLSEYFGEIRTAINLYVDAYLHLHNPNTVLERIERQSSTFDEESFRQSLAL